MNINFTSVSSGGGLVLGSTDLQETVAELSGTVNASYDIAADLELANRISLGHMDAFEELYAQYYRRIFALCYRMTRSQYEAEDLTHDIFVHVYKKIQSFRGQSALMTWLHRVTVNQVLMHFRRKNARPKEVSSDTELDSHFSAVSDHRRAIRSPTPQRHREQEVSNFARLTSWILTWESKRTKWQNPLPQRTIKICAAPDSGHHPFPLVSDLRVGKL